MSWLDPLLAIKTQQAGTTAGTRQTINFASGATVTDDPANDRVNVAIAGGLPGVTVTGTPTAGQTVVASSASAAAWGSVPRGSVANTSGATGDLITGNATTLTRLGIGSTGQVLTVSGGAPVWSDPGQARTTYELDFATVAAEVILNASSGSASRTYGGVDFSFEAYTANVKFETSASGLTVTHNSGADGYIRINQTQAGVSNYWTGNWRAWLYLSTSGGINKPGGATTNTVGWYHVAGTRIATVCQRTYNPASNNYMTVRPDISGATITVADATINGTNPNVVVTECVGGVFSNRFGLWSAGWPSLSSLTLLSIGSPSASSLGTATTGAPSSGNYFIIDCYSAGAAAVDIVKSIKIEVW